MSFRLTSNDANFNDRVNSLFDSLESASKECEKLPPEHVIYDDKVIQKEECESNKLLNNSTDFCFKKPFRPKLVTSQKQRSLLKHGKCLPDFVKNPKKWTCYSLGDTECNTDAQNQIIGAELMLGLKQGNVLPYQDENKLSNDVLGEKIEFKKTIHSNIDTLQSVDSGCATVRKSSEHFILPNYEIGKIKNMSKKNYKKNQASVKDKKEKCKELILSHLCEEEYEDDTGI